MNNIETMNQWLEELNDLAAWNDGEVGSHMDEPYAAEIARRIITSLNQAIEQAQQAEPVAYRCWNNPQNADGTFDILRIWVSTKPEGYGNEPLYTAPPVASNDTSQHRVDEIAKQEHERAQQQEPRQEAQIVNWNCPCGNTVTFRGFTQAPPPRQPLTDEEINKKWSEALADTEGQTYLPLTEFARAIEAAHGIKEKKHD